MRIEINDPELVPSLLAFLRERVHLNADRLGPCEVEVSQLGSMNQDARRVELDLLLQVWRASHENARTSILD
ncbi:MAG TPA: hypothetical protein VNP93_15500 [Gaiellaceae bacterium]|nr:hypothetical protein [Gaiellaceae bacterium]